MHKQIVQVIFACLFAYALGSAPASGQTRPAATVTATTGPAAITPVEAQRAMDILQDEQQRAEVLRTLKAIADSAPASAPATAPAAPAATPAAGLASLAGLTATPASTSPAIVPLEKNGLIARMLHEVGRWFDGLDVQFDQLEQAMLDLPVFFAQTEGGLGSEAARSLLLHTLATLAAVFAAGLALEWGVHHLLRRPRRALVEHAEQAEAQARERNARENERRRRQFEAEQEQIKEASRQSVQETTADTAAAAGTRPAADNVALVQTHRDGIERVEAVPVGTDNAAGGAAVQEPAHDAAGVAGAPVGVSTQAPAAETVPDGMKYLPAHRNHWHTLRHLPYAAGALMLDLLPLALFFVAAALLLRWLAGDNGRVHDVTIDFVNAYVTTRVTMAILRLLVSPVGHNLQVLHLGTYTAALFLTRARRIVALAAFGLATADALQVLGAGPTGRLAFIKVISLVVHIFVVTLLLRLRRPVGKAIRAANASGPLAAARDWLAQVWAFIAATFVMGAWFVWAMGVEDGFPKLIHFIVISVGIIVTARVVAILLLGVLGRIFHPGASTGKSADAAPADAVSAAARARLAERYYAMVRNLVTIVIAICAIVALFQAWGLDAIDWFAAGTIGRSLTSAALTIVVSIIVAIFVWEAVTLSIEQRLARWTRQGDLVRAARLRTLLPMLRTGLFIVVVLILGLTALNELGINTTPMLAGASIIGVALGFGSQKLVQDFITGIFLLMENAMRVGDWVTVAGVSGSVEYLSIRTVRLRGGDGSLYIVPFSSVSTVNNTNRGLGNAAIRFSVAYDTDVERAITELKNIGAALRKDPAFRDQILNDIEIWGVDAVDGAMVTLAGQMRCSDAGRWGVQREINRRVLERFREIGIEIANPRASLLLTPAGTEESKAPAGTPVPALAPAPGQAPRDGLSRPRTQ